MTSISELVKLVIESMDHIIIHPSPTADSRNVDDPSIVTKDQLLKSSKQHIQDVNLGLNFFKDLLTKNGQEHDTDKITDIDRFHNNFISGFDKREWLDDHYKLNRHHLREKSGIPDDVNLVDVIEYITDCVMAGKARSGKVSKIDIDPGVLKRAFNNTVRLLEQKVKVL